MCTQNTLPGACHKTLFFVSTHCAFDVVAQRQIHSIPVAPLFTQCFLIQGSNARWRESGRLVDSAQNTGYEPKLADFSHYTDLEHNLIDISDNNPDFPCSDDVTMISGSSRGMPNSEASRRSRKAAASKVSFLFGHTSSGETGEGHVSGRSGLEELGAELDRKPVATTLLSSQSREKRIEG